MVAVFGTLPEETLVIAEEGCALHLRRVLEDAVTLAAKLLRRHRHAHLNVLDFPFCPCAAIHPDAAVVEPCCTCLLLEVNGCEYGVRTLAVCAVRVGEVACHVNLMRLHFLEQRTYNLDVILRHRELLYLARLIEREVEEVDVVEGYAVVGAGCACLTATDESLYGAHLGRIDV